MSTYPTRVAVWQEECELHGTAQVCHICPFLPLSAEFEVTENFGDFWVSFFHVRNLLPFRLGRTLSKSQKIHAINT